MNEHRPFLQSSFTLSSAERKLSLRNFGNFREFSKKGYPGPPTTPSQGLSEAEEISRRGLKVGVEIKMGPFRRGRFVLLLLGLLLATSAMGKIEKEQDPLTDLEDEDDSSNGEDEAATVVASRGDDDFDVVYESPDPDGEYFFAENFDDVEAAKKRWIISKAQKEEKDNVLKYEGKWDFDFPLNRIFPTDKALIMKSKAQLHAISSKLKKPFEFRDKPLIVQYEVNFQNGMECGGAYVKLLSHNRDLNLNVFNDKTPYTIMFGPDKCGSDMKVHFIFRHKNPINGTFSEKHAKPASNRMEETYSDKKPHMYRLKLTPDNKFEIFVDDKLIKSGSMLDDMTPPINPPMEIEDPNAVKPADWDEREKIQDPTAVKPEDWDDDAPMKIPDPNAQPPAGWLADEPVNIPDPTAVMPEDWDESMDGSWEPPLLSNPKCESSPGCGPWTAPEIDNPNFRGKWKPQMMSNPNYKGKWVPPRIPNPDYFEDKEPFKMTSIGAVGLELWTMSEQVLFDNFIITNDQKVIDDWTSKTWELKRKVLDKDNEGVVRRLLNYSNAHPWLWAVYVLVVALPVVLIFTFCCGTSPEKKLENQYKSNLSKKTDGISPDDALIEEEEGEDGEAEAEVDPSSHSISHRGKNMKSKSRAVTKDDLEAEEATIDGRGDMNAESHDGSDNERRAPPPAPEPTTSTTTKRRSKARKE